MATKQLIRSVLAAMLAAVAPLACAGERPSSPLAPQGASSRDALPGIRGLATPRGKSGKVFKSTVCSMQTLANGSGVFGPGGGTLVFGTSSLIIPGGALRDTVTISAIVVDTSTSRVELLPHGLVFEQPVGLLLDTSGCVIDETAPSVVYLSESGEILETISAVYDPRWQTIAAPLKHFSGYAIAF